MDSSLFNLVFCAWLEIKYELLVVFEASHSFLYLLHIHPSPYRRIRYGKQAFLFVLCQTFLNRWLSTFLDKEDVGRKGFSECIGATSFHLQSMRISKSPLRKEGVNSQNAWPARH